MSSAPPKGAPSTGKKIPSYPPNQTLYVTNLPSAKIRKHDLRVSLYMLFSTYGPVLDVVAVKTMKMRGQAHIVFRDIQTATQAMRALQGFDYFGMEMEIQYAKSKSDTIAKLDGTFHKPAAAAGEVTATELQQSIFNAPPSIAAASTTAAATTAAAAAAAATAALKPSAGESVPAEEARTPGSVAGQKRRRDEEEEAEESEEEDVEMEEDSDDE